MATNILSLSGGKDSTCMLLRMLELGEPVTEAVFYDTHWEFPQMYDHLARLEDFTGIKITRLSARIQPHVETEKSPFDYMLSDYPVTKRGTNEIHYVGCGWPNPHRRWCTGRKQEAFRSYMTAVSYRYPKPIYQCIGFAADEAQRTEGVTKRDSHYVKQRYPLIEWGMKEDDALEYCLKRGFDWGGLYRYFKRVSCFCCPLAPLHRHKLLRRRFPDLWARMLEMEAWLPEGDIGRRFYGKLSVSDLEARFANEDKADEDGAE